MIGGEEGGGDVIGLGRETVIGGEGGGNVIGWGRSDGWPILHTISTDYPGKSSAQRKWKELLHIYSAHNTQRPSAHCQKYICVPKGEV